MGDTMSTAPMLWIFGNAMMWVSVYGAVTGQAWASGLLTA